MSEYFSIIFNYSNEGDNKINSDELLSIEAVFLVCDDDENGIEFQVEYIECESENLYSIELLVENWLYNGIKNTLNHPKKVVFGIEGVEIEVESNNLFIHKIVELDDC